MTAELDYRDYWERAFTFDRYVAHEVETNRSLWEGIYKKSRTPKSAIRRAAEIGGRWKLLVLSEDWCGDASNFRPRPRQIRGGRAQLRAPDHQAR